MSIFRAVLGILLLVILIGFIVYNASERVSVTILQTKYLNVPLVIVAFWAFVLGLLISFLFFMSVYFKQNREIRRLKRVSDALNNEVSALRSRSVEDSSEKFLFGDKENQ